MVLILGIMAYHRIHYTIGFMGWYDTFKNTKINYFLFTFTLAEGPLLYLYVRSLVRPPFKLRKQDLWHFLPVVIWFVYRLIVLLYDAQQPDWNVGYEGKLQRDYHMVYVAPLIQMVEYSSQLLYLAFSLQLFLQYREKIQTYFSNTYKVELNWIRNFLAIYTFLFLYGSITNIIDALITELHYIHRWWIDFFSAIAIVYLGIKAYFTDLTRLYTLTFDLSPTPLENIPAESSKDYKKIQDKISQYLESQQAYLNPDFTLKELAGGVGLHIHEVSEAVNNGFQMNFNELVNQYRVEEVKRRILDPTNHHLSLLSIGLDSGFNSKATFNRVFKKLTGQSPSAFKEQNG